MKAKAVGVAGHRWRRRFAELLRAEIARTLANPIEQEVEAEWRHRFGSLSP